MTFECTRDVAAEAQATIATLRDRQAENREDYDAATADGNPTLSGVSEYLGLPMLVVPFRNGDGGDRPLAGRPDRAPPLRSSALSVTDPGSDTEVDELRPNRTYELTAEIRNEGDMDVPPTIVEFFADHRPFELHFDTTDGFAHVEPAANQTVTGWTTLRPGTELTFAFRFYGSIRYVGATVQSDRTFAVELDFSGFDTGHNSRLIYLDAPDGDRINGEIMVTNDPVEDRAPIPLSVGTGDAEFVGMHRARVPAGRTATASVEYTAPSKTDQELGAFFVRAYSIVPLDAPEGWGTLDHRADRHVGRTEVSWR